MDYCAQKTPNIAKKSAYYEKTEIFKLRQTNHPA